MSIFRRILGILMMIIGIVGLIIAVAFGYYGRVAVDSVAAGLNSTIAVLQTTVGTTVDSLVSVKSTLNEAQTTVDTVSDTVGNLSTTLFDTQPLLEQVTSIATETVPDSLEAVQGAIPNLAGIAGSIDTTLERLDDLKVERAILGVPFSFDLGITYNPREPFDAAVLQIGDSFVGLPEQLRSLDANLGTAVDNIATIGANVRDLSGNLADVSATLGDFPGLLDQYIGVLNQTEASLVNIKEQFEANLNLIKWVITGLGVWFALYQVVPLYVGWRMITDDDDDDEEVRPVVVAADVPATVAMSEAQIDAAADHLAEAADALSGDKS
jgi:methyl-accepting chemotaxis protein